MKNILVPAVFAVACCCSNLIAEPFFTESAVNVLPTRTLELGISPVTSARYDSTRKDIHGNAVPGTVAEVYTIPLYARYAVSPQTEVYMSLYAIHQKVDDNTGLAHRNETKSGMDDPMIGARYTLFDDTDGEGWSFAGGFFTALPLGEKEFRKGFDFAPLLAARKKMPGYFLNLNLFYDITGAYNNENTARSDPGDVLEIDGEVEYPAMLFGRQVELSAGIMAQSVSDTISSGSNVASTNRMNLILGIRRTAGNFKTKLGFDLSLGNKEQRLYDYRFIAGLTCLMAI